MPRLRKTRLAPAPAVPSARVLDLNGHIATRVAIFANRLSRSASRYYRERYGLGVVEWRLTMFIGYVTETCANRICRETDLDKGAVSRGLNALARMGLVGMREDGTDSRRVRVALTSKGRALHDRLVPIAYQRQREMVAEFTEEEVRTFLQLIDRLEAKVHDGEAVAAEPLPRPAALPRSHLKRSPGGAELPRRRAPGQGA